MSQIKFRMRITYTKLTQEIIISEKKKRINLKRENIIRKSKNYENKNRKILLGKIQ